MSRRPIVGGGKPVVTGDQQGVFFSPSPEMQALSRWQAGDFLEVEREFARVWRRGLSGINLEKVYRHYQCRLRVVEDAKEAALRFVSRDGSRYANLNLAFDTLGVESA
jgi:hypothetical protein